MARYYKIVKRNGEIVPLDITKIRQVIEWASEGLDVNTIELESNIQMRFKNNMTTKEIQENLIDTALQLTSIEEPDWRILAARLKLMDLYKDVKFEKNYDTFGYDDYLNHIKKSIQVGLYDQELIKQYSDEELKIAGSFLDIKYDMDFDYAGVNLLINRYLLTRGEKPWELPQEAFLTIALLIERFQPKEIRMTRVKDTYEKLAKRKLSLATPMLMNLRKPYGNLSSCFITAMDDSRDSIYYVIDQIAEISKNGGGVGVNISRIRCSGSWINNIPNASGGVIPWIKNINDTVVAVNQQGKRCVSLDSEVEIIDNIELDGKIYNPDNFYQKNKANLKNAYIRTKKINVNSVKLGDYIKSFNLKTQQVTFNKINEIIPSTIEQNDQAKIKLINGDELIVSKNTKLFINFNNKWSYMHVHEIFDNLNKQFFMMDDDQNKIKIEKIEIGKQYTSTNFIDFNVENDHNFFVKRPNDKKYKLIHNSGACTVALDIWHLDIEDFLELQTENGDQRMKAFDIFPQVVIPDIFMRKNKRKEGWLLVDPYEIKMKLGEDLAETWGEDFDRIYKKIEKMVYQVGDEAGINLRELENEDFEEVYNKLIRDKASLNDKKHLKLVKRVNARELFKAIMRTQIETGMPYLTFKDAINRANPNKHDGMIGNGNLCQESYSNFRPSKVLEHSVKQENGENIIIRKTKAGLVHTCNLNSINLAYINNNEELKNVCETAVRLLDNAIDFTDVPIKEGDIHNKIYRTIGVGTMGLADYLAKRKVPYTKAQDLVEELFENIAYYIINASISLAKERGKYPKYEGSDWSKGLILGRDREWYQKNTKNPERWLKTFDRLSQYGIRNSHLMMIAPNTSSSLVQGCSASVLPVFSKFYIDKNSKGAVPIMPPFIKENFWYYQEFKNIPQKDIVDIISRIQKWTDTGISMELIFNLNLPKVNAKYIFETLMDAWEKNIKTIYYIRSIQKASSEVPEKNECISCSN